MRSMYKSRAKQKVRRNRIEETIGNKDDAGLQSSV